MKVWDAAGIERDVEPADAKEIIAVGGSAEAPVKKAVKEVEDVVIVEKPKRGRKAKNDK